MRVTLNPNHHINALSHRRLEGFFDDLNRLERKIEVCYFCFYHFSALGFCTP